MKKDQICTNIPLFGPLVDQKNFLNWGSEKLEMNHDQALFFCFRRSVRDDGTVVLPPVRKRKAQAVMTGEKTEGMDQIGFTTGDSVRLIEGPGEREGRGWEGRSNRLLLREVDKMD